MSDFARQITGLSPQKLALLCLDLQEQNAALKRAGHEPIAVIGAGCRFPGGAHDSDSYWNLLERGVDAVSEVPAERWDAGSYYDPDPEAPGKMYTRHGGWLRDIDLFDPTFFDITPREAENMDPQQRLLLEVTWEALEHAAVAPSSLQGTRAGVYVGVFLDDYAKMQMRFAELRQLNAYTGTGNTFSIAAGRLSYVLGVHGPSLAVDTACSASLVALHLACQSLRHGEADLALAGGVNLILTPDSSIFLCKARALSPDGRCKTFDARADGYARSEGCGVVVLKRLSDALRDGNRVLAVVRGSAVNHDGPSSGLTVPNGTAQVAVMRAALADAGVEARDVGYVEAHGTGTALGDPIEIRSLATVYGGRAATDPLIVGSVKTNFGHAESAAGVAGLIKLALALERRTIPPHLHLREPNPHLPLRDGPFLFPAQAMPWPERNGRRLAALSSFGLSGTNVHVIVEQAPSAVTRAERPARTRHVLALSAKSPAALADLAQRFEGYLAQLGDKPLADVCHTAGAGRAHFAQRLAVVGATAAELREQLEAFRAGRAFDGSAGQVAGWGHVKTAFLFTGQGAQYAGMGRGLYESEPTFRRVLDRCAEALRGELERPLLSVLFGETPEDAARLDQTLYTQPALFAFEAALAELLREWGLMPDAVLGHSLGELAAACFAGVFELEPVLRFVARRARLMQSLPAGGAMAAVLAPEPRVRAQVERHAGRLSIAALNGPANTVVSGEGEALEQVVRALEAEGVGTRRLTVSHAFHSPLMEPIEEALEQAARELRPAAPRVPLASNLTGRLIAEAGVLDAAYWRRHLRQPVRFAEGVQALRRHGCQVLVEIGPAPVLLGLARRCWPEGEGLYVPTLRRGQDESRQLLNALAALYVHGADVDWRGVSAGRGARPATVPGYPWQRKRYWVDVDARSYERPLVAASAETQHALLGRHWPASAAHPQRHVWESAVDSTRFDFVGDHRIGGMAVAPLALFLELAQAAGREAWGDPAVTLSGVALQRPLVVSDTARVLQVCLDVDDDQAHFTVHSRAARDEERAAWTPHATARLRRAPGARQGATS